MRQYWAINKKHVWWAVEGLLLLVLLMVPLLWIRVLVGFGGFVGLCCLSNWHLRRPPYSEWLVTGLFGWLVSFLWVEGREFLFRYWLYFFLGALWYVGVYSLRPSVRKQLTRGLGILALSYVGIALILRLLQFSPHHFWFANELFTLASSRHSHIADLAMLGVVAVFASIRSWRARLMGLLVGSLGMGWGMSRTAVLALGAVVGMETRRKYARILLAMVVGGGIVLLSVHKPLLESRPYYRQSLQALGEYPFGVGVGNFGMISEQRRFQGKEIHYSELAHSLPLELLVGLGFLAFPLLVWLGLAQWENSRAGERGVSIAVLLLFLFDVVYAIPFFVMVGMGLLAPPRRRNEAPPDV